MRKSYDVVVVGLGAMGSAAAYHLSKRGKRVIGFDLATPPHSLGSTHGQSRVIREAYFEHPLYVPIVQRSYELWAELQQETEDTLLIQTGGLLLGPDQGTLIGGTRLSADRHGLAYDMLTAKEVEERFPVLRPIDSVVGLWEPRSGILLPENCVETHLRLAEQHGAELHLSDPVMEWKPDRKGVRVKTRHGEYRASQIVMAPGAWLNHFLPDLALPLTIERQVLYWFEPRERRELFGLDALPFFAWEYMPESLFYCIPDLGDGVKVALHHQGEVTDIENLDRHVHPEETEGMRYILNAGIPELAGPLLKTEVCMYTNTPDEHFVVDFHPELSQVLIVSACSGHGFKFAAVMGEIIADLLIDRTSAFDLSPFSIARFSTNTEENS
jgi:sarcosine oxidase